MDTLPLELHAHILQFACIDDGSTARALSQVSHYTRQVAAPYLYQSLAVSGLDQMTDLLARLDTTPTHLRQIRHLFLSDWTRADTRRQNMSLTDTERYAIEKELAARILAHAAPTLETLALVVSCPFNAPPLIGELFSTPLPRLAELSVHGFYPYPRVAGTMPRLERLHLSGNTNPHGLLQLGALDAACPALTHLRLHLGLALPFARELRAAALPNASAGLVDGSLTSVSVSSPFLPALPRLLKHVAVKVRRLQEPAGLRGSQKRYVKGVQEKMLAALREIEVRRGDTSLEMFSVAECDDLEMYDVLRKHWLGSLYGSRLGW